MGILENINACIHLERENCKNPFTYAFLYVAIVLLVHALNPG